MGRDINENIPLISSFLNVQGNLWKIFSKILKNSVDNSWALRYTNSRRLMKAHTWEFSSAGRASALQAEGRRFEPYNSHQTSFFAETHQKSKYAEVAQW